MKILALESSAAACSAALCEDEFLLAQSFQNSGLTHSRTLMPMVQSMLEHCGHTLAEVDVVAVAAGPGSFTGLRIGVSAAKGLAWPDEKPCAACSTLESMAWCLAHTGMELCAVMDARRNQVYNARFRSTGDGLLRLCPDRAVALAELAEELKTSGNRKFWLETARFYAILPSRNRGWTSAWRPPHLRFQSAWGVARCALEQVRTGRLTDAASLSPDYHRLSQAERERLAKEQNKGE